MSLLSHPTGPCLCSCRSCCSCCSCPYRPLEGSCHSSWQKNRSLQDTGVSVIFLRFSPAMFGIAGLLVDFDPYQIKQIHQVLKSMPQVQLQHLIQPLQSLGHDHSNGRSGPVWAACLPIKSATRYTMLSPVRNCQAPPANATGRAGRTTFGLSTTGGFVWPLHFQPAVLSTSPKQLYYIYRLYQPIVQRCISVLATMVMRRVLIYSAENAATDESRHEKIKFDSTKWTCDDLRIGEEQEFRLGACRDAFNVPTMRLRFTFFDPLSQQAVSTGFTSDMSSNLYTQRSSFDRVLPWRWHGSAKGTAPKKNE